MEHIINFFKKNSETWDFFENFLNENKLTELNKYCIINFGIQICLVEIWENWGIKLDIIIGHSLGEIAGIAGIIKSILILIHQKIPKNIHIKKINENLNLHNKMKIVTENINKNINIIGVSGFGGSNGHILLKIFYH